MSAAPLGFEVRLSETYDRALDRVTAALKAEGFGVLSRIDVHATLKEKIGAEFRPYAILGACNPALAHRALTHRADVGLLLPCNVTVEAAPDGPGSVVRIGNPDVMMALGGLETEPALQAVAHEARARLERVAAALAAR
jgi:uncharacterized protein (DUF302 family)